MRPEDESPQELLSRVLETHALLASVCREMGPATDLESTLRGVIDAMRKLIDFRGGSICLVADDRVSIAAADPEVSAEVAAASIPVGSGIAGRVVAMGETVYSGDLDTDERVDPELRRLGSNAGMTSYLATPLVCLGEVIGLLQVDSPERDAFDDVDRMLLEGLATQVASAIASARQFDELRRLEGLKTSFIQMVSHELRTPLAISGGMLGVVLGQFETIDPDEMRTLLERAGVAVERLEKLVEELLFMTRLLGGALRPRLETLALAEAVRAVLPDDLEVEADGSRAITDPELFAKVLTELVDNAELYAGGATVSVAGGVVRVRDHGPGLPPEVKRGESFRRGADNDTTIAGLGLGLTLVRALAAELDIVFTIGDADGGGTVAELRLPSVSDSR